MKLKGIAGLLLFFTVTFIFARQSENIKSISDKFSQKFKHWNEKLPEDRIYIHCDKPFYAPGETIWLTAYVRDASTFKASTKSDIIYIELQNPKGSVEKKLTLICKNGIGRGDFQLSDEIVGGIYSIKAYTNWQKNDPDPAFFTKEIQIQQVVLPRLKMKMDFAKKAYGPGDKVHADLLIETNEKTPLSSYPVNYSISIAGTQVLQNSLQSDKEGKVKVVFDLPKDLSSTDGLLNVMLQYDGQTESISRSIPIVLNKISLSFFPEGGDQINDLTSLVAFKALNEFNKPADIEGYITDQKNNKITQFSSFHMGMGAFTFKPSQEMKYKAHITKPEGITQTYDLPEPLPQGYILRVEEITNTKLKLVVGSTRNDKLRIFLQIRGKEYYSTFIDAKKGMNEVNIDLSKMPIGVAQITLFDSKEIERAERLVFINKHKQISVEVKTNKEHYQPREKVKMTITATDETGMRMPGNFSLAVVDDQLLSFADDKSSTILSHMLAESDVKGKVEEPRFYFDPKQEKADRALDLLLLTQGWRRFTWRKIMESDNPKVSYNSEKAVIAGVAMMRTTNKAISGATICISELNIETKTDSNGVFSFNNVDLSSPKTIKAKYGDQNVTLNVNQYTSSLEIWFFSPEDFSRKKQLMQNVQKLQVEKNVRVFKGAAGNVAANAAMDADIMIQNMPMPPEAAMASPVELQQQEIADDANIEFELLKMELAAPAEPLMKRQAFAEERIMPIPKPEPEIVYYRAREYPAPDYSNDQKIDNRSDFRSTIYWQGDVELQNNGTATVEFYTSDALTSFRAVTEGFTVDGGIGRAEHVFYTKVPFSVSAKMPTTVITGDTIQLPLVLKNSSSEAIDGILQLSLPPQIALLNKIDSIQTVKGNSSKVVLLDLLFQTPSDSALIGAFFKGKSISDGFTTPVKIISQGFPVDLSFSGNELNQNFSVNITKAVKNSISASFKAYPSVVSDLLEGIESILQEPYGCFEQTSVTSYPNALVLSYLKSTDNADQKIVSKAEELLKKGYKRLITFETKEKGYEWFGGAPGHEALTAYGLMQFNDMNRISNIVDKSMVERTSQWLLSRRDGKGGFNRNPQALDSYGSADQDITNAYIVYALAEAGRRDIQNELEAAVKSTKESKDPYVIALVANALFCFEDFKRGDELLRVVLSKQADDGSWSGNRHSITRSEGLSLKLETTSLICLAIMQSKKPDNNALTKGIKFIVGSRSGKGGFGATQSTILSLKALTKYAQYARKTDSPGTITILVNGTAVAKKSYGKGESNAIAIDLLEKFLKEGSNEVSVAFEETEHPLPYTIGVSYNTWKPASSAECKVKLDTRISSDKIKVGETVRISSEVTNTTKSGLPMTMALIGLPAGLSAQPWQLKELQEKKVVDFYEISGSTVVFYFRQMKPGEKRVINLDCKAEIPGYYTPAASRAYLYYTNEHKVWTSLKPVKIGM